MLSESSCFQCVLLFKISIKHLYYIIPLLPLHPVCLTRCNMVHEASYSCCDVVIWWLKDVSVLHLYSSTFPALYWFWLSWVWRLTFPTAVLLFTSRWTKVSGFNVSSVSWCLCREAPVIGLNLKHFCCENTEHTVCGK